MYIFYLDLILNALNTMKRTCIVFYYYNHATNQFNFYINSNKIHATHFFLLIYIFLLLISGLFGMHSYSILQKVLCMSFIAARFTVYSVFNLITTSEAWKDAVNLLNKMLSFEVQLLNISMVGEYVSFKSIIRHLLNGQTLFSERSRTIVLFGYLLHLTKFVIYFIVALEIILNFKVFHKCPFLDSSL